MHTVTSNQESDTLFPRAEGGSNRSDRVGYSIGYINSVLLPGNAGLITKDNSILNIENP